MTGLNNHCVILFIFKDQVFLCLSLSVFRARTRYDAKFKRMLQKKTVTMDSLMKLDDDDDDDDDENSKI